jgi:hypothetical protein
MRASNGLSTTRTRPEKKKTEHAKKTLVHVAVRRIFRDNDTVIRAKESKVAPRTRRAKKI